MAPHGGRRRAAARLALLLLAAGCCAARLTTVTTAEEFLSALASASGASSGSGEPHTIELAASLALPPALAVASFDIQSDLTLRSGAPTEWATRGDTGNSGGGPAPSPDSQDAAVPLPCSQPPAKCTAWTWGARRSCCTCATAAA